MESEPDEDATQARRGNQERWGRGRGSNLFRLAAGTRIERAIVSQWDDLPEATQAVPSLRL